MNKEITGDVAFFLAAMLLGAVAALVYDLLRVWRRFRPQTLFAVSLQDFCYWFLFGLAGFRLIYSYNDGTLRAFTFLGIGVGACLYILTLGRFFVNYGLKLLLFITFPLRKGLHFLKKQGKLIVRGLGKRSANQKHHGRTDAHGKKRRKKKDRTQAASAGSADDVRSADL